MTDTTVSFLTTGEHVNSGVDDLAYFDLDVERRIISRNGVATHFLNMNPQYVRADGAEVFVVKPVQSFTDALQAACDPIHPVSSVFIPYEEARPSVLQINVLPFYPGLARIVLFWMRANTETLDVQAPELSVRERAVLNLFAAGLRRDRIAHELNISLPTVDMHSRNLRRKLAARTTPEAVAIAINMQLLEA
ncbi:response regulator transcription factor [Pacificibacter marinus]|uniref:response regulator transcription factor n=1 Tax=Pacificibacter marinus TaxID=658057 RepID=UPI001C065C4A|nr:helix-turn-helix transcriptional regulator [Pacificibacter marinus]MBU2867598.1 helix-turn-helix transcriptional regulator [Pacificibacter marinus]